MLDLKITPNKPRILYIGSVDSNPGLLYYKALIDCGYSVYCVGDGAGQFNTKLLPRKPYHIVSQVGPAQVQICEFSLKSLLDIVGYEWDAILHVQNWLYFTDVEMSPIPYFFYCTEIAYPRVPRCAWFVLTATDAIKRMVKTQCKWVRSFLYHPHSVPILKIGNLKYPRLKKTIRASFAGELYSLPLYRQRREVIKYLEKEAEGFEAHYLGQMTKDRNERVAEGGNGHLGAIQYTNLLLKSQIAVNIPSVGGTNFRDLESLAAGAELLTMETPDLLMLGLEDKINCRTFETKEEAAEIIKEGWEQDIALNGWRTIFFGRKWIQHQDINVAKIFRYKGFIEHDDTTKNYMKFWINGQVPEKIKQQLSLLKQTGLIQKYNRKEDQLNIIPKSAIVVEDILLKLGFVEWQTNGHTIYHRIKELAVYMNRSAGVVIPPEIDGILGQIKARDYEKKSNI